MSDPRVKPLKVDTELPETIVDESGAMIGETFSSATGGVDAANARRLAAAWNATRIFTVEDLEAGVVGEMIELLKGLPGVLEANALLAKVQPAE